MKKKHLWKKALSLFSLSLLLIGCTTLTYVDDDWETIKKVNIQTDEMFSITAYEKYTDNLPVKMGISETVLENALLLYVEIKNTSDSMYKFDIADFEVTSPIGEVSIIPPIQYIEAYQNYEAANYTGLASASAQLNQFANIQNQYRKTEIPNDTRLDTKNIAPELAQLETTIRGIQAHTINSYKFISPKNTQYYYIFIRKPEEYPIVVKYKDLTYKFGGKKNVQK